MQTKQHGTSIGSGKYPNQDRYFLAGTSVGVFDGVGGSRDGAAAAQAACDYIKEHIRGASGWKGLAELLTETNGLLKQQTPYCQTTAAVAMLGQGHVKIAHCGDSRVYRLRDGGFQCLTLDHSLRSHDRREATRAQLSLDMAESADDLQGRDREAFRHRNVVASCLGNRTSPEVDYQETSVMKGDIFVLTTDGVHDNLTYQEIGDTIETSGKKEIAAKLVERARKRSLEDHFRSKPDDITAAVMLIEE